MGRRSTGASTSTGTSRRSTRAAVTWGGSRTREASVCAPFPHATRRPASARAWRRRCRIDAPWRIGGERMRHRPPLLAAAAREELAGARGELGGAGELCVEVLEDLFAAQLEAEVERPFLDRKSVV